MGTIHCSVFPLFILGQFSLDMCFGIRKLHQAHFVFLLIVHGYQSLLYYSSFSSSQVLISIAGKVFTSHLVLILSFFLSSPSLDLWPGEAFYLPDPMELTFANTLLLSNAAVSLGGAFVCLEISCSSGIFFSLISFILAWTFISLQIKEFRVMGLFINDSVYSSVFFFLTGLHFFHLVVGLFLLFLFFWSSSFPYKKSSLFLLRVSEVHLFYNLLVFYWHFLEILWLFI